MIRRGPATWLAAGPLVLVLWGCGSAAAVQPTQGVAGASGEVAAAGGGGASTGSGGGGASASPGTAGEVSSNGGAAGNGGSSSPGAGGSVGYAGQAGSGAGVGGAAGADGTLRIMPIGDSITVGSSGTNAGYRGLLYNLLRTSVPNLQYVGSSLSGSVTTNVDPLPDNQRHNEGHSSYILYYQ
jgi:hypothetical protein